MTPPRRRADATENRSRIIDAAQALITRQDALRLNEVAKRAGVGQGTLYRHFPTREDLLAEVYRHDVDELVVARRLCSPNTNPSRRLRCGSGALPTTRA